MWEIPSWVIYLIFFLDFFMAFFYITILIKLKTKKAIEKYKERTVTFIVPAYNRQDTLKKCIESIENLDYPKNKIKIIIVDDGSKDNTLKVAKNLEKKYSNIFVLTKKNGGKASAINFGIKKVKTELIAVLDADSFVEKNALNQAMPHFMDDYTGSVTFRLKPTNTSRLIEKMQYVEYTLAGLYRKVMGHMNALPVTPAFSIFRKEVFEKYGGFDENNITEDFEMGLRIQANHHNVGYVANSYALTEVPNTLVKWAKQRLRWSYGTVYNYNKYKRIFFNSKYGDLGFMVLPSGLLSMLTISLILFLGLYSMVSFSWSYIQRIMVGWVPTLSINTNLFVIPLTDLQLVLFLISLLVGIILYLFARLELKEKIGFFIYIITLLCYVWILAIIYIYAIILFLIKKKPGW